MKQTRGIPKRFVDILTEHGASESVLQAAEARRCGDCSYCCTWFEVEELEKPVGKACPHLGATLYTMQDRKVAGCCTIFGEPEHPRECQRFFCTWRLGYGSKDSRPDRAHLVAMIADSPNPDKPEEKWTRVEAFVEPDEYRAKTGQTQGAVNTILDLIRGGWLVRIFVAGDALNPIALACAKQHPEHDACFEWCSKHNMPMVTADLETTEEKDKTSEQEKDDGEAQTDD